MVELSLSKKIKSYFNEAVKIDYDGSSNIHPIIILNSLKNILGDNRKDPSKEILDCMEEIIGKHTKRKDDKDLLNNIAKECVGLTVFIADLEDACQDGEILKMENAAARLQWVSENGLGVFEVLLEVALQDFHRLGTFSYHLQRANHFNQEQEFLWSYNRCLLKEISKEPLPEPHEKVEMKYDFGIPNSNKQIVPLSSANRLWDGNYIRINGIRRELSHWYASLEFEFVNGSKIIKGLEEYVENGGNLFIECAEELIKHPNFEIKIIELEAIRFFLKKAPKKDYPIIAKHLERLL